MTDSDEGDDPKETADVPPVLPGEQSSTPEGGGVLSPEELDFTESPYVSEVSDGRYVVSPDHNPPDVPEREGSSSSEPDSGSGASDRSTGDEPGRIRSPEVARSVLADELDRTDSRFGMDIVSQFDDTAVRHRTTSDDVVGTFDNLILWYAQNVATDVPTQRTASFLLAKSEFTPPLSPARIRRAARKHDLGKSSTIAELLEAVE